MLLLRGKLATVSLLMVTSPPLPYFRRLAAGVLTQANKVGEAFESVLPDSFRTADAPEWKRQTSIVFDALCLDRSFFVTLCGTSFFQHILNGTTFVLLAKGKAATAAHFGRYLAGGLDGTVLGGVRQVMRTVTNRFLFVLSWNWLSSHSQSYAWMDTALAELGVDSASARPGDDGWPTVQPQLPKHTV